MASARSRWLTVPLALVAVAAALELAARGLVAAWPTLLPEPPRVSLGRNLDSTGLPDLLRPDHDLLFALAPDANAELPRSNAFDLGIPRFRVHTNASGYRTPPFAAAKAPGVTRIVVLGDAVSFGAYVDDEQAYPRQLAARLEEAAPGTYEVINLAVPGYTSRQGLELLRRQALALRPDLVVFAFGSADRLLRAAESDDARMQRAADGPPPWVDALVNGSTAVRLFIALVGQEPLPTPKADLVQRASLDDLTLAIVAAQQAVESAGGRLLVLNADFAATDALDGIRRGVRQSGADYLDAVGAVRAVARQRATDVAVQHQLPAPPPQPGQVAFRVEAPAHFEIWLEIVRGGESTLVPMRDDGSGGDQVAHDDVFTALVPGRLGERFAYTYRGASVLGPVREFTRGTQRNPTLRVAPATNGVDRFGVVPLMADSNLPDAEGHALIAQALAAHILTPPAPVVPAPLVIPAVPTTPAPDAPPAAP
ncbi:SGNH/GDSL hydrolase family protein [bacterium]|nr:SGNH/GDSL hydrolase family protein [bacterium]